MRLLKTSIKCPGCGGSMNVYRFVTRDNTGRMPEEERYGAVCSNVLRGSSRCELCIIDEECRNLDLAVAAIRKMCADRMRTQGQLYRTMTHAEIMDLEDL